MDHKVSTYPAEMAQVLSRMWREHGLPISLLPPQPLPALLLDAMYQASMLREEGVPIRCRVIFATPHEFEGFIGAQEEQLHVLRFETPCDFTPNDIRKLAAAASYYRSMLAVDTTPDGVPRIWGVVFTGTKWVNLIEGGRAHGLRLPRSLVIQILGPGQLVAASGYSRVLEMANGRLLLDNFDPFRSEWLPQRFQTVRETLLHEVVGDDQASQPLQICDSFVKDVAQGVVRRVLSVVRNRGHGGTLIFLPETLAADPTLERWLRFRVRFPCDEATLRFRKLMQRLMRRVIQVAAAQGLTFVTWDDYQQMQDAELNTIDDLFISMAQFIADLMDADGAVVLDQSFRLIGFGGEILGDEHASWVERALDLEAVRTVREPVESDGTRHRSAYRLVTGLPEAIAVIISQDGGVRFVAHHRRKLTYWPYLP